MEFLEKIINTTRQVSKKEFEKYVLVSLAVVCLLMGGVTYFIYSTSNGLVKDIKQLQKLAKKSARLVDDFELMQKEEEKIRKILNKHKGFNLGSFFEKFCKDQGVKPEPNWSPTSESLNPQFEEVSLAATFKGQATENLVKMLEAIDKNEILYVKELRIRKEKDKTITFDISLATQRSK